MEMQYCTRSTVNIRNENIVAGKGGLDLLMTAAVSRRGGACAAGTDPGTSRQQLLAQLDDGETRAHAVWPEVKQFDLLGGDFQTGLQQAQEPGQFTQLIARRRQFPAVTDQADMQL
jgi:hypothetical protein